MTLSQFLNWFLGLVIVTGIVVVASIEVPVCPFVDSADRYWKMIAEYQIERTVQ